MTPSCPDCQTPVAEATPPKVVRGYYVHACVNCGTSWTTPAEVKSA